jgi:outer membrane protein OmpA-like peptidoglycan-associated protein
MLLRRPAGRGFLLVLAAAMLLASTGCATKKFVRGEIETTNERMKDIVGQVESNQDKLTAHDGDLERQDGAIHEVDGKVTAVSKTAREALGRAIEAGKLAEGKLLFETVLSDDQVRFGFDRAELGESAREALAAFAAELKEANENVFIEIQGHTDATGSEDYNLKLGEERAQAVRRELNRSHGLPLHRMSVISYGEAEPVADNSKRDERARNRRVVLVVLK